MKVSRLISNTSNAVYTSIVRITSPSRPAIPAVLAPTTTLVGAMTEARAAPAVACS